MNTHQPMLNFEPSPEAQRQMLPVHQKPQGSPLRKGLPPVQDGQPLNVDDVLRNACILTPDN